VLSLQLSTGSKEPLSLFRRFLKPMNYKDHFKPAARSVQKIKKPTAATVGFFLLPVNLILLCHHGL
jgi:hypothetical protein